ncbi:SPOR domain-containing protein [Altererythrobacter sp. TH136]|nr:SPOR domain-containing protein [Altererythrobacter sp. TH136]TCJ39604.1 SPOR domain-containing protein [Parafrankia sp. BMG5.11]
MECGSPRLSADRAAKALDGFARPLSNLFRVRTGPYITKAQAEAALAKVRAAGYSDARVTTAG